MNFKPNVNWVSLLHKVRIIVLLIVFCLLYTYVSNVVGLMLGLYFILNDLSEIVVDVDSITTDVDNIKKESKKQNENFLKVFSRGRDI